MLHNQGPICSNHPELTSRTPSASEERLASCLDMMTARLLKASSALPLTTGLSLLKKKTIPREYLGALTRRSEGAITGRADEVKQHFHPFTDPCKHSSVGALMPAASFLLLTLLLIFNSERCTVIRLVCNLKHPSHISKFFCPKIFISSFDITFPKLSASVSSVATINVSMCSENTTKDSYMKKPSRMELASGFPKALVKPVSHFRQHVLLAT